ncbi:MAG: ATP-dependent RecD-like DNA helicase [bacterium]|nr:ATP-dependent RecD-like DNA helicase [bacterium]
METITGYIDHIIFQNAENGYTVLELVCDETMITCVGSLAGVTDGMNVELQGEYTEHPSYGRQFKVRQFEEKEPEDEIAIERYLGSGAIKGVGAALAARIVRRFGKDTFRIIEQEPEQLVSIKGISERKAQEICIQVEEKRALRSAMIFLQQYGISLTLAVKIYNTYGEEIYSILQKNPYRLADDIEGVGFRIADEIASRVGIRTDSDFRIRSGLLYVLQQAAGEGHTYLPKPLLFTRAVELLGVPMDALDKNLTDLAMERKVVIKHQIKENVNKIYPDEPDEIDEYQVYATVFYNMESNVAYMLKVLGVSLDVSQRHVEACVDRIEKITGIELASQQKKAVIKAAQEGVLVITGGPGTGKTTTINSIIHYLDMEGEDFLLAAPTGRAAKRMSETTGYEAKTIHRMLELGGEESVGFGRDASNPLEADAVIIDEMSMVDLPLMNALLKAVTPGMRLILVGDVNQLPSVGPGSVLKDIIHSGCVPVVELNEIFRQAKESDIIVNAHRINHGEAVSIDNKSKDFFFLKRYDADQIINVTLQLVLQKMPKYVEASPLDIQVLTPMRKGLLGVERLNTVLQHYLNPPDASKSEKERANGVFREGDKVMQTKNNYQLEWEIRSRYGIPIEKGMGVFNGDVGIIRIIDDFAQNVTVEFEEGRMVVYPYAILDELELAYAITIHKSQGSEYPAVVIPLMSGPKPLMNRNLLYTAVTRARSCVTLVGDDGVFEAMIGNAKEHARYSGLLARMIERATED